MLTGVSFYSWHPGLTSVIDMWDLINMAPSYSLSLAAGGGRVISSPPDSSRWWTGCRDQPPVTITSYSAVQVYCALYTPPTPLPAIFHKLWRLAPNCRTCWGLKAAGRCVSIGWQCQYLILMRSCWLMTNLLSPALPPGLVVTSSLFAPSCPPPVLTSAYLGVNREPRLLSLSPPGPCLPWHSGSQDAEAHWSWCDVTWCPSSPHSVTSLLPFLFKIFVTIFPFSLTINFPLPVRFFAVFADISPEHLEKIPQCTGRV